MLHMYYQQSPSGWCRYPALGLKGSEGLLTIILPRNDETLWGALYRWPCGTPVRSHHHILKDHDACLKGDGAGCPHALAWVFWSHEDGEMHRIG